jgi:hypothetical protein
MGGKEKRVEAFIDEVPSAKLTGLPTQKGKCLYKTEDFRLDMQGVRTMFLIAYVDILKSRSLLSEVMSIAPLFKCF